MSETMTAEPPADDLARMAWERDRNGPPVGFPALPSIPGGRYVDPAFLALEDVARHHVALDAVEQIVPGGVDDLPGRFQVVRRMSLISSVSGVRL